MSQKIPECPDCKEKMIRASMQLEDDSWIVVWLCKCVNTLQDKKDADNKGNGIDHVAHKRL